MTVTTKARMKLRPIHLSDYARAKIVELLVTGPTSTYAAMRDATGMKPDRISRFVHELRRLNLCHIGDWDYDTAGRPQIALFVWGPGPDAKKPKLSRAEVNERQRSARRAKKAAAKTLDALFDKSTCMR